MSDLNLGLIGNCSIAALIDKDARIVWSCLPRFDGDPVFHALLGGGENGGRDGVFEIELEDQSGSEQSYLANTAVLRTVLHSPGGTLEIVDFCPRFKSRGRSFRPQMIVRRLRPLSGTPRLRIRARPRFDYGKKAPRITSGSNHVRFVGEKMVLRLTSDAPIDYLLEETLFNLDAPLHLILGPDETLGDSPADVAASFEKNTIDYWREWTHRLALPLDWQDAVIRAAITLKLCSYEPTGAIVAAMTTSIPESPDSGRNWDYRFCWVRDAFFVVRALNSLAAVQTMETYFRWLMNLVANAREGHIQPVYGIGLEEQITERIEKQLQGYRGMGPVRVGNQAHEHYQHDTYGNIILGAAQAFFDRRLIMTVGPEEFQRLEALGEQAFQLHKEPDAGIWELRTRARIHTSSSLMCWAACDRLAKIAGQLRLTQRAAFWGERAALIRKTILERAWSDKRKAFVESFEGETLDASVLLMGEVGFIDPKDPRFVSTVEQVGAVLGQGPFMLRYEEADDFGKPEVAFNICAFWRLDALARIGRREEAKEIFEALLAARTPLGLMSEDTDMTSGAPWGNFPQTYSMVGIINGAVRLSRPWEHVI
ncbi:glycoside hydrolase family 15 protein [Limibacillus halophilus]